jgi:hypothetical protein
MRIFGRMYLSHIQKFQTRPILNKSKASSREGYSIVSVLNDQTATWVVSIGSGRYWDESRFRDLLDSAINAHESPLVISMRMPR